ncbi:iron ABC transporter permease [Roseococcus sp. SYP-B2431]|uniref:ABC transporter permease n=1 Tax=Roseococcus sp. SYP-B2431 TaxID=2496640 RepID=UPI0010401B66|nr:iron ABC transporter permease [Roseococcus sp. SYP-B2431]TCH99935.1 iron ABC transporter permease [Roseococcus sp. SYP-B2431]
MSAAAPRRQRPLWVKLTWPAMLLIALPLAAVLAAAMVPAGQVWWHIWQTSLPELLGNTAALALLVAAMAGSAGAITAWLVTACRFPGRDTLQWALLLPLAMPAYVSGYAWVWLMDVSGPVQSTLREASGLRYGQYWFPEMRSLPGAALVLAMVLYPYVYLLCRAAFLAQSTCLLEVSRTLGESLSRTFWHVALPLARPALAAGVALVLMEVLADFGTVQHFGLRTFTTGIYEAWFAMADRGAASQLAAALLLCVALLLALEQASRGGRRFHPTTTRQAPVRPVPLRPAKAALALLACGLPLALGFLIPAGTMLSLALRAGDPLAPGRFLPFLTNSLTLAAITAALAVALAAWLAWAVRLHPSAPGRFANRAVGLGYAIPGSVIAVGTLVPFGLLDNALDAWLRAHLGVSTGLLLSGTIAALVFAYLVRFLGVALASVESGLARLKPSFQAAARSLGAGPGGAVRRVELPLSRGALLTAAILVFVDTMKELPATLIVRPFDFDTLAVRVYNLAADERLSEASTSALLIVVVGLLPVGVLAQAMRR